jgi:hypothetical protein
MHTCKVHCGVKKEMDVSMAGLYQLPLNSVENDVCADARCLRAKSHLLVKRLEALSPEEMHRRILLVSVGAVSTLQEQQPQGSKLPRGLNLDIFMAHTRLGQCAES